MASTINELQTKFNSMLNYMNAWFTANGLSLNTEKRNIVKFSSDHLQDDTFYINFQNKIMKGANNIKFLGLELDKHMNWKNHIGKILPKMSSACYVIRSMYHLSGKTTLKIIYFAYFHSIMEYRIAFWGGAAERKRVFQLQKRIIRIMTGSNSRTSCKPLF
jgi:hypothetical protein